MEEEPTTKLGKALYFAIDAMFWVADEAARWWEIGKITIQLKDFQRRKAALTKQIKDNEKKSLSITTNQTSELTGLNESILKLTNQNEAIKSKCWAFTPDIFLALIFLLFFFCIITITPMQNVENMSNGNADVFSGKISRTRELPLQGHTIISDSIWFNNKLYVAGNNGVTEIDTVSGQAQNLSELPVNFFAKSLRTYKDRLIIAGYSGIYQLDNGVIKPLFVKEKLPFNLINSLAITNKNQFLIGTLGHGILRSNEDSTAIMLPNTQNYVVKDFGRQNKELWVLHEEGILTGNIKNLNPLELQILAGKKPRCMATTDKNVYIGTDHGIVAGFRNVKNWVWTMISSNSPGYINKIVNTGEIIFIASDEGVFRYSKGKMDRLSNIPVYSLCLCDTFLAAIGKNSVMLYYFDVSASLAKDSIFGTVPELGTYTPDLPMNSLPFISRSTNNRALEYGLMDTDGKQPLAESAALSRNFTPDNKPMLELPVELQKPIFSDAIKFENKYYLATLNRGIWSFDGKNWSMVNSNGNSRADKLCGNNRNCYAYSAQSGIYELLDNVANIIIPSSETQDLKKLVICDDDTMLLYYANGKVKTMADGGLTDLLNIPSNVNDDCHSIWKISQQYVAILNNGIMTRPVNNESHSEINWQLQGFNGNSDTSKIADVKLVSGNTLYIALNDGRIFEYSNGKPTFLGIVPDYPTSIIKSDQLLVTSKDSVFFKENNGFFAESFKSEDPIIGAYSEEKNKVIYVFTSSGLRILNKK